MNGKLAVVLQAGPHLPVLPLAILANLIGKFLKQVG
jgi:hypothetical protein